MRACLTRSKERTHLDGTCLWHEYTCQHLTHLQYLWLSQPQQVICPFHTLSPKSVQIHSRRELKPEPRPASLLMKLRWVLPSLPWAGPVLPEQSSVPTSSPQCARCVPLTLHSHYCLPDVNLLLWYFTSLFNLSRTYFCVWVSWFEPSFLHRPSFI